MNRNDFEYLEQNPFQASMLNQVPRDPINK